MCCGRVGMSLNRRKFLRSAAQGALIGSAPLIFTRKALAVDTLDTYGLYKKGKWRNWSHNVEIQPQAIVKPQSLAEVQAAVGSSSRIRAFGSAHSISSIAA